MLMATATTWTISYTVKSNASDLKLDEKSFGFEGG